MPGLREPQTIDGFKCYAPEMAHDGEDFPPQAFERFFEIEAANFWFRSRNRIIAHELRKYAAAGERHRFLEIGCGTGYVLSGLAVENRYDLTGAEVSVKGLVYAKTRLPGVAFMQLDARDIPFASEFDAIGAFDVIEHIEEDTEVMRNVHRALAPGGVFLVTVPQHHWLWSRADDYLGHKRRYSRSELIAKLERHGFHMEFCSSFVFFLLPLMFLSRLRKKSSGRDGADGANAVFDELTLPKPVNALLELAMRIDELLIRSGVSLPVGGSLLAVARKIDV